MEPEQRKWKFTCPKCQRVSNCTTNIQNRHVLDKQTTKRINTAVGCGFCDEVTIIDSVEELFDIEFDWKDTLLGEL